MARSAPHARRSRTRAAASRVWGVLRESAGLRTLAVCDAVLALALGALEVTVPALAQDAGATAAAGVPARRLRRGQRDQHALDRGGTVASPRRALSDRHVHRRGDVAPVPGLPVARRPDRRADRRGAGFGLLNLALFELLDHVVAPDRSIEALTWLTSAQGLGLAGGRRADRLAPSRQPLTRPRGSGGPCPRACVPSGSNDHPCRGGASRLFTRGGTFVRHPHQRANSHSRSWSKAT